MDENTGKLFAVAGLSLALSLMALPALSQPNHWRTPASQAPLEQGFPISAFPASALMSGQDIVLNNTSLTGGLMAGKDISCQQCRIEGTLKAGRDVQLQDCPQVRSIMAGRNALLRQTEITSDIMAGKQVELEHARVGGAIQAGSEVQARQSQVLGPISTHANRISLQSSVTADIRFVNNPSASSFRSNGTNGVIIGSGVMQSSGGGVYAFSGNGNSLSMINGYQVRSANQQTTVITPDNTVYVNAQKVSGDGPDSFKAYRELHPDAPKINAPGWDEWAPTKSSKRKNPDISATPQPIVNILELSDNSTVNGDVFFDSGPGKVIVHTGSTLRGKIINGSLEKQP